METLATLVKAFMDQANRSQVQERGPFENKKLEFTGEDVSEFLEAIEERALYYRWTLGQRISNIIVYSDRTRKDVIMQSMPEFKVAQDAQDWDEVRRVMRQRFRD